MSAGRYPNSHPEERRGCGCRTLIVGALGLVGLLYLVVLATTKELRSVVQIEARPDVVWHKLTDIDGYARWNPHIEAVTGEIEAGSELVASVRIGSVEPFEMGATITSAVENKELGWSASVFLPWICDAEDTVRILPRKRGGCRVVHTTRFRGLVPALLWWKIEAEVEHAIEVHNNKLKSESEQLMRYE